MVDRHYSISEEIPSRTMARRTREALVIIFALVLCALLAVQVWRASQNPVASPLVHQLKLSVKVVRGRDNRSEFPPAHSPYTTLLVEVNPFTLPQDESLVKGLEWIQHTTYAEYRSSTEDPWTTKVLPVTVLPSATNKLQREVRLLYPQDGHWRTTFKLSVHGVSAQSGEHWQGDAVQEIVFDYAKPHLRKMQYSWNGTDKWKDVPQPGQPGFPMIADQYTVVGFRAIKIDPTEPGPGSPNYKLLEWEEVRKNARHYSGEGYFHFPDFSKNADDLFPIKVTYGNSLTAYVRVKPTRLDYP